MEWFGLRLTVYIADLPFANLENHEIKSLETITRRLIIITMEVLDFDRVQQQKAKKRFRRFSVSMDIEFPDFVERLPVYYKKPGILNKFSQHFCHKSHYNIDRLRTMSSGFSDKKKTFHHSEISLYQIWGKAQLKIKPDIFPFHSLPEDCKLVIFSKLTFKEKGICSQVCLSWNKLVITPRMWSNVDFNSFPLCYTCPEVKRDCTLLCYNSYKKRIKSFIEFLTKIKPCLFTLKFSFDIGDPKDRWLPQLERLFKFSKCQNLSEVEMNWKDTPAKLLVPTKSTTSTWSYTDCKNYKFDFRHRQRLFISFFDQITQQAPNITSLILPFHFSERTLSALCKLKNLKHLELKLYFWMQELDQNHLSILLQKIQLVSLTLEVWVPTGPGFEPYNLKSSSLVTLDISPCRGLYLEQINLPNLKHLKVSRHPLFPPFYKIDNPPYLACLHAALSEGAPKLVSLNDTSLPCNWREHTNLEMEAIFNEVCCCQHHR